MIVHMQICISIMFIDIIIIIIIIIRGGVAARPARAGPGARAR